VSWVLPGKSVNENGSWLDVDVGVGVFVNVFVIILCGLACN
jgi:hypothetical protein